MGMGIPIAIGFPWDFHGNGSNFGLLMGMGRTCSPCSDSAFAGAIQRGPRRFVIRLVCLLRRGSKDRFVSTPSS